MTPRCRHCRSRLSLWLGGLLLGAAVVQARSTGQASASATIVSEESLQIVPEGVLITELAVPEGTVQIEVAATPLGVVLIKLSNPAPPSAAQAAAEGGAAGKSLNSGSEPGSIGHVGSAQIAQNAQSNDGALSGEMVVTVSAPSTGRGTSGKDKASPLRIMVEFN